jgi:hypothetical protein
MACYRDSFIFFTLRSYGVSDCEASTILVISWANTKYIIGSYWLISNLAWLQEEWSLLLRMNMLPKNRKASWKVRVLCTSISIGKSYIASRGFPIIQIIWWVRKTHFIFKMLIYVRRRDIKTLPIPEYDGFNLEAKVLKLFDGVGQEPTCSIHVTWATDSVMGLDCVQFLNWRDRTTCVSFHFTTPPHPKILRSDVYIPKI